MKKGKIFTIIMAMVAVSVIGTVVAQRGGYHGGYRSGYGMHDFNHNGYAVRPYIGVATIPYGGYGYGPGCGYMGYRHQWRCW